jgi:hypothetical protein
MWQGELVFFFFFFYKKKKNGLIVKLKYMIKNYSLKWQCIISQIQITIVLKEQLPKVIKIEVGEP